MRIKISAIAALGIGVFFLSSCATKYQPVSGSFWTGQTGYSEVPLDSSTWQVTFAGNNNTTDDVVNRYALYRGAELTVQHNYDYFVVLHNNDIAAVTATVNNNKTKETKVVQRYDPQTGKPIPVAVTNTHSSSTVTTQASHTVTKTIRMFTGARPSDNPDAYEAKSMLSVMGPTINR